MRLRKKPHASEELKDFLDFVAIDEINSIKKNPERKLYVELGTGKGDFISQIAARNPKVDFVGLEIEPTVVLMAARKIREKRLTNVHLLVADVNNIEKIFLKQEVDRLYINFCDPWPKKRHAKRRLTHINFLEMYKRILNVGGEIFFKTDNLDLFNFSFEQFSQAGFEILEATNDLHVNEPMENIRTEYENKFSSKDVPINFCIVKFRKEVP